MIRCRLVYVARGGTQQCFIRGRLRHEVTELFTRSFIYRAFLTAVRVSPLVYILLTNDAPFTYLIYKFASGPFNCYK